MILDKGNIISLIALQVAITSICFALIILFVKEHILWRLTKTEEAADTLKTLQKDGFYLSRIAENAVSLFVLQDSIIRGHELLLMRLLKETGAKDEAIANCKSRLHGRDGDLDRCLQTLVIYSSRDEWRQSALKQLSESCGNADTLDALVELSKYETTAKEDLRRAIRALRDRLNESVRHAGPSK